MRGQRVRARLTSVVWVCVIALEIVSVLDLNSVEADDTILGSMGGRLVPLNSKNIRLVRESVRVRLDSKGGSVWCMFVLKNDGPPTRVRVGFPQPLGEAPLRNFRCTVGGRRVKVHRYLKKAKNIRSETAWVHPYDGWHWWWMRFARDETKIIVNTYQAEASQSSTGNYWFTYILKTGATWKGSIRRADIQIDVPKSLAWAVYGATPPGYHRRGCEFRWNWKNLDPRQDIKIEWNPAPRLSVCGDGVPFSIHLPARRCIRKHQVYVPARRLAKKLSMQCDYDENTRTLSFHRGNATDVRRVVFKVGSREAQVRGQDGEQVTKSLLTRVYRLKHEIMVPLLVLSDAFGWTRTFSGREKNCGNYMVTIAPHLHE